MSIFFPDEEHRLHTKVFILRLLAIRVWIVTMSIAALYSCKQNPGTADSPADEETINGFFIESVSPAIVTSGDELTVYGSQFTDKLTVFLGDSEITDYTFVSARELRLKVPTLDASKKILLQLKSKREEARFRVLYTGGTRKPYNVALSASEVCEGETYYDFNGEPKLGTKSCSGSGSYSPCSGDGATDCVVVGPRFAAADTSGLAPKVIIGEVVAGVSGSSPLQSNCSGANQSGCVATATYRTMDVSGASSMTDLTSSNLSSSLASASSFEFWDSTGTRYQSAGSSALAAANIKAGVSLFGVTGNYPSALYPLPSASATADLDNATFDAKIKSSANFEYWTSAGVYQTGAGDADIDVANIKSGTTIFNATGTLTAASLLCQHTTQANCQGDSACQWVSGACSVDPWNIRVGKTIGSTAGQLKTTCRNRVNSSIFNSDVMPPGTAGTIAGTTIDWWDTIDDWNNDGAFPTSLVAGWSNTTDCDRSVWRDLTADGACDTAADDCLMQDRISGLMWSEQYPANGVAPLSTTVDWSVAVSRCDALSYGGYSDWRLPTQKELQEAYVHGIRDLGYKGSGTIRGAGSLDNNNAFIADVESGYYFWSASSFSSNTINAWAVYLPYGNVGNGPKTNTSHVLCVRP